MIGHSVVRMEGRFMVGHSVVRMEGRCRRLLELVVLAWNILLVVLAWNILHRVPYTALTFTIIYVLRYVCLLELRAALLRWHCSLPRVAACGMVVMCVRSVHIVNTMQHAACVICWEYGQLACGCDNTSCRGCAKASQIQQNLLEIETNACLQPGAS